MCECKPPTCGSQGQLADLTVDCPLPFPPYITPINTQKPSVFITGATGLIGSYVVRLLLMHGYERITALRRRESRMDLLGDDVSRVRWVEGDLDDDSALMEGMHGADWVIHSAALISYQPADRDALHRINVAGTANVVNAALACGVEKLLHVSSVSVLSRTSKNTRADENTPWQKTRYSTMYGLTKHLAEMEVHRGAAEGLKVSFVVPSLVIGAGFWSEGSLVVIHRVGRGLRIYPTGANGFVDVRDVALLMLRLLEDGQDGARILVNGYNVTFHEFFQRLAVRLSVRAPGIRVGRVGTEILWRLVVPVRWLTGRKPLFTKETMRAAQAVAEYDNARSLSMPGFRYTPLDDTLDDIATEYRQAAKKKFEARVMAFRPQHLP